MLNSALYVKSRSEKRSKGTAYQHVFVTQEVNWILVCFWEEGHLPEIVRSYPYHTDRNAAIEYAVGYPFPDWA